MRLNFLFFALFTLFVFSGCHRQTPAYHFSSNKEIVSTADQMVKKYHAGEKPINHFIKVVYFHGSDQEPFPHWKERLNRTLNDVSDYYKEEFSRFGVDIDGIPFERSGGELVINVVEGDLITRNYDIQSGPRIQYEIYSKTKGQIDFSKDHILVINSLCSQQADGIYVFNSPYYGTGSLSNGNCQVADCELLDSKLLKDSTRRMKFSEMAIKYKECSVAEFNSWYIGGIAHEMGHLFGLPHDFGRPSEFGSSSLSMMGMYGSRHFRDYLWGGKVSSHFSIASILQLIGNPLFAQSSQSKETDMNIQLADLKKEKQTTGSVFKVNIGGNERPYGVVALVRKPSESEYLSRSFCNLVSSEEFVGIELGQLAKGNYNIQLLCLFSSGEVQWQNKMIQIDSKENVKEVDFPTNTSRVDIPQLYKEFQRMEKTKAVQVKLEILEEVLNPSEPMDPKTRTGNQLFLSDAKWEKASVGWEQVARNYFTCERPQTFFLELQGEIYSKGLFAHSPSSFVFNLDGKWKTFSAIVGLRDYAHMQGSAKFTVIGDGNVLYESAALRTTQKESVKVDISKVRILELQANGTEGHNFNSWAIWVNPLIER